MFIDNSQGDPIWYETFGKAEGEALLLLPGSGQSALTHQDSGLAECFAGHFRLVLMDFTGMGRSCRVESMVASQWCDDVVSVLDALQIDRAHIAGSSLGSRVGARVAAERPERVNTLLVDTPITIVEESAESELSAFFNSYESEPLRPRVERWHGERWREAMAFFCRLRAERSFQEYFTPQRYIADIVAPTLIARGDQESNVHPLAQAMEWHATTQRSSLWIEPLTSNFSLMSSCPEAVVNKYVAFVAQWATAT